jgi:hypothetical protein
MPAPTSVTGAWALVGLLLKMTKTVDKMMVWMVFMTNDFND